jgi:hypothetical protein
MCFVVNNLKARRPVYVRNQDEALWGKWRIFSTMFMGYLPVFAKLLALVVAVVVGIILLRGLRHEANRRNKSLRK